MLSFFYASVIRNTNKVFLMTDIPCCLLFCLLPQSLLHPKEGGD